MQYSCIMALSHYGAATRIIALVTEKRGSARTTLVACLAVAASEAREQKIKHSAIVAINH
jgi:hypothetical protein